MTKAVFTVRHDSIYDDLPEVKYHFPGNYLRRVEKAVDDWIIYYEPGRSGGRRSYFATAKLSSIERDPQLENHYYAIVSHYLEFDRAVPFREGGVYYESNLKRPDGEPNRGAFGHSVRNVTEDEYARIFISGFDQQVDFQSEVPLDDIDPADRPLIRRVVQRPFRDHRFRKQVKTAYRDTCAITGIKIVNGGGRSEVQAAHIRPVKDNGPDSVRNGIALCSTLHWVFDRGLISIADDYTLLMCKDSIPGPVSDMINVDRRLSLPNSSSLHPHQQFLEYHRDNIFKG